MQIIYREGKKISISVLTEFLTRMDCEFPIPLSQKVDIGSYVTKLTENGYLCCALDGYRVVGIIAGYNNNHISKSGYISILVLDKNYRGRRISVGLVEKFIKNSIQQGMHNIEVYTHETNIQAIGLYEKLGFLRYELDESHCYHYIKQLMQEGK